MSKPTKEQEEQWQRTDDEVRKNLPPGVKLVRTLRGHTDIIGRIAWSPDGRMLASPSKDDTIRLWDSETGKCVRALEADERGVLSVAFNPMGGTLAAGTVGGKLQIWEITSGKLIRTLKGHQIAIYDVAFNPFGTLLASGSSDGTVKIWEIPNGRLLKSLESHGRSIAVWTVAFSITGDILASSGNDSNIRIWEMPSGKALHKLEDRLAVSVTFGPTQGKLACSDRSTVGIWDAATGKLLRTLEGHTDSVKCVSYSGRFDLLGSKSSETENCVRLWRAETGECVATIPESGSDSNVTGFAFHPRLPFLATVGSDAGTLEGERDRVIHIWELDLAVLLAEAAEPSAHYINAKVVLVGDTGVGKSGLSLVLNNQPFEATDSTPGRRVWTMASEEALTADQIAQTRETLLWDLAGQPGYRVIHQLHLNEVAVALVVFDARSETDPLAGVRHWERALRLAHQRQGSGGVPMKKFLVSARNDRGGVAIGEERLQAILKEFGFDGYFKTSAKEGWAIKELREAIEQAIPWEVLPDVASSQLFADIKSFLVNVKESGRLLALPGQLYDEFVRERKGAYYRFEASEGQRVHTIVDQKIAPFSRLRAQFDTCIGRLETRDLIRRLTFGGYVLLQPELLDAYASAMVNTAKEEPDGLGSLAEEVALAGKFFVPKEQKITDPGQEQLLLHATVEELVQHDLALRENADDGRYLVFPSQFNRDYEDAPEPKGKAVAITFDGPVQSLYSTLAVRLGHSGLFTTGRAEMWRNAAVFTAKAGGKCGLFVNEFSEGRGRLILFFDEHSSHETRFHFEEYVLTHTKRRALDDTVELVRFFVCPSCGDPVPDSYVKRLRDKGVKEFPCPCGGKVSLAEPKERIHFESKIEAMDKSADRQRDFDAFVMSAKGETSTAKFQEWAGGGQVTLAIVFTDVVGSTAMGEEIGGEAMNEVRRAHFVQSRKLIGQFKGQEIKTIGDSFMAAFKSVDAALDYARALQKNTGHQKLKVRAGIHLGSMQVEENDVFGGTVNFAARVVGAIKGAEIWISDRAKQDIEALKAKRFDDCEWQRHDGVVMKGFPGVFTLWSLKK